MHPGKCMNFKKYHWYDHILKKIDNHKFTKNDSIQHKVQHEVTDNVNYSI